jgi:hypothetical protein
LRKIKHTIIRTNAKKTNNNHNNDGRKKKKRRKEPLHTEVARVGIELCNIVLGVALLEDGHRSLCVQLQDEATQRRRAEQLLLGQPLQDQILATLRYHRLHELQRLHFIQLTWE